jgi:hypothetical protein
MSEPRREFLSRVVLPLSAGLTKVADPSSGRAPEPSLAWHAANRLMFGPRPGDVAVIEQTGYEAFLEEQLSPESIDDSECDAAIAALNPVTYSETWQQLYDRRSLPNWSEVWRPLREAQQATAIRMVMSKRQLYERLVDFWHNHFNINGWEFIVRSMFTKWDLTIRQHALGNFRALLEATASHPCMLYYLDNYLSTNAGPNENYARELFELHTLGAMNYRTAGGYVDNDVYEASRCFTGWTFETNGSAPARGEFKYVRANHDRFQKIVLGHAIPNDQADLLDGRNVLDILANHPGTARFICWKLCQRLVHDDPPPSLVLSAARVFQRALNAPDQIKQVVGHICRSPEFTTPPDPKIGASASGAPARPGSQVQAPARLGHFRHAGAWDAVSAADRQLQLHMVLRPHGNAHVWVEAARRASGCLGLLGHHEQLPVSAEVCVHCRVTTATTTLTRDHFGSTVTKLCHRASARRARSLSFWLNRILQRPASEATMRAVLDFVADGRGYDIALSTEQIRDKAPETAALCTMTPEFMRR